MRTSRHSANRSCACLSSCRHFHTALSRSSSASSPALGVSDATSYAREISCTSTEGSQLVCIWNKLSLAAFDGQSHAQVVDHFRRLDLLQLKYAGALFAARHADSVPKAGGNGAIGVLWREFEKRRRFLPIRTLMMNAGNAIQAIKPVFMMSPISIANYLPPGALNFDLVVFDEASQVRPVDALGAIARGKQIVVVGRQASRCRPRVSSIR